jgi:RNA polymerase sigma factor (sigma-70 family)
MAAPALVTFGHLLRLSGRPAADAPSDSELLGRFAACRDGAAFAQLVRRHGPLVLRVCRQLLQDPHDAEDAFQATFLVLVRKAGAIGRRELLANWLYGVAYRVAARARATRARRRAREKEGVEMAPARPSPEIDRFELPAALHEELQRLPVRYRSPVVLCYLQARTNEEAARELGCPLGTLKARLARARALLRGRLARRGCVCSAAGLLAALGEGSSAAAVPARLLQTTVAQGLAFAGPGAGALASGPAALARAVLGGMAAARLKVVGLFVLVAGRVAATAGGLGRPAVQGAQPPPAEKVGPPLQARDEPEKPTPPDRWRERVTLEGAEDRGSPVVALALSRDGTVVLAGHEDGTARVWNALNAREIKAVSGARKLLAVHASADGKRLLIAGEEGVVSRDAGTYAELGRVPWKAAGARRAAFAPDGKTAAVAYRDGLVELWRLTDKPRAVPFHAKDAVYAVALSPDGKTLAAGTAGGTVKLWDVATRKEWASLRPKGGGMIRALAFSADGKTLASAHGRRGAHVWAVATLKELPPLRGQPQTFVSLAFSPDGRLLVAGSANGNVRVWDLATREVLQNFKHHAGQVHALTFASGARAFATASMDTTVKVWRPVESVNEAPREPKVTAAELDQLLKELREGDDKRAVKAILLLAGTPRQTLVVLKATLRPVRPVPAERVARLLADLDDKRFVVREKATEELERCSDQAREELHKALARGVPEEVRRRVLGVLARVDKQDTPDLRFQRRAVEVLERIAVREARAFLDALAAGVPDAHLTRYAQDALKRLDE